MGSDPVQAAEEQDRRICHSPHEAPGEVHSQGHFNQTSGGGAREEGQLRARHLRVGEAHRDRPGDQGPAQDARHDQLVAGRRRTLKIRSLIFYYSSRNKKYMKTPYVMKGQKNIKKPLIKKKKKKKKKS